MNKLNNEVVVTIRCLVFNHEPYLRQCLDGFVMQKTNFKFEAIVHDDCSTDGSALIIKEYAEKFPDIIKPIYETENQYSKHDGSLRRIMNEHMRGKYVAMCEGDDYWTDPYKLQKQVDFLEAHPDYSMCFANAIEHWENGCCEDRRFSSVVDKDYSALEIYNTWIIPTASTLYRTSILYSDIYRSVELNHYFIYGDIVTFLSCAHEGKIRGFSDVFSVYRRHGTGMSFNTEGLKYAKHCINIPKVFGHQFARSAFFFAFNRIGIHRKYWKFYLTCFIQSPYCASLELLYSLHRRFKNKTV